MFQIPILSTALLGFTALAAAAQEAPHSFPIQVYISTQLRSAIAPSAASTPLSPALQNALRLAVNDWNRVVGGLLAQPSEQGFTLVLGSAPAREEKPKVQVAPVLSLVEDRRMADLVIEPVAEARLDGKGRTGLWIESSGNYLGTRFVSVVGKDGELAPLALRRRLLQQIGVSLGLAPRPDTQPCNLMSGALTGCKLPPAECAEQPCVAVLPSQLQQVQRLVRQMPPFERAKGKVLPSFPEEAILNGWSGKAVVQAYVNRTGQVEQAFVGESSGNWTLDQAALAAVNRTSFAPARSGGKPVSAWLTVPIVFQKEGF